MAVPIIRRVGARVILLDAADRLLLLAGRDPVDAAAGSWWFTPGGGVETGETDDVAAMRELREETGLRVDGLQRLPWRRTVEFTFAGARYSQSETYFFAEVAEHAPAVVAHAPSDLERATLLGHRWWDLGALAAANEPVHPSRLAALVADLVRARDAGRAVADLPSVEVGV